MHRKVFLVLLTAIALSGCAGHRIATDDAKCRSYGATIGSPAYVNCRGQLDAARTNAIAINSASTDADIRQSIYGPPR